MIVNREVYMDIEYIDIENKPEGWPSNAIEFQLENINNQLKKFNNEPSYVNKEILISMVTDYDLNQRSSLGLHRTTDYEVSMLNSLFINALLHNINALKTYIYEVVGHKTRMQKMASWFPDINQTIEIKEFMGLMPQLSLYHISYQRFTVDKDMNFADKLIETVETFLDYAKKSDSEEVYKQKLSYITRNYISLINDISYFRCVKRTSIWAFSREEIYKVFELAARLTKFNCDSPIERPLKGVLMTSISNYILKSRNDYNEDYICKYLSKEIVELSVENHEIWMSIIENLNDDREQKVVPELFEEKGWNNHSWAKDLNFKSTRKYYVSCFCKTINDETMLKDYGSCVYGYKDDRMADILSPIAYRYERDGTKTPYFSQVIAFDVVYSREEAKKELNLLFKIIECFDMNDEDKRVFLEQILQYWMLSVKDEKWSHDRERRYVLFMYDDLEYIEVNLEDDRFLKLKTSVFIHPDFILGDNPVKGFLRVMADNKRNVISTNPYLFCIDCHSRDFDNATIGHTEGGECQVCGSENIVYETPSNR